MALALQEQLKPEERRADPRKQVQLRARIKLSCGQELIGHTVDVSSGGMSVVLPDMEFVGEECVIHLDLAACGSDESLELVGCVTHSARVSGGYRTGMRFSRMSAAAARFLKDLLR